ncbi:hypothetical protein EOD40_17330 [Flavobacterium sufflavum]|uniref:Lipoprotein n=1 Tax=Flavobacterium sufflavum TaxID=1921138 RepID=A0A437KKK6_9FLAO|nr:hypothetical protein [Flavobacterium sufflavum]RVT71402.1 hypothetical protein EOD40_17330 [Flavobacterium sufflavum]
MTTYINTIFKLSFFGLLICSISCKKEDNNKQTLDIKHQSEDCESNKSKKKNYLTDNHQFYYYSPANNRKYDRQVTGIDENGKNVNGVINLENEIAIGILKAKSGKEIEIISDQINTKEIIATDANGFMYRLKMD